MKAQELHSIKRIEKQLHTGEEPVLVMCSDINIYVCKYMRSSASAYKLACEFIGSIMAKTWKLPTPDYALIRIKADHWEGINLSHSVSAPSIGTKWLNGVVDITPSTYKEVPVSIKTLNQLLWISLFDFWIANEDRNANNANLMFDVINNQLISIDYGCILNTATFDYPLTQLTTNETILCSDIFQHLSQRQEQSVILQLAKQMETDYSAYILRCQAIMPQIIEELPLEWNVPLSTIQDKLAQLSDKNWISDTWNNFIDSLIDNINYEK